MKTTGLSWTFMNRANPSEYIVVHDARSAECLQHLLKHHEDWVLRGGAPPLHKPAPKAPEEPHVAAQGPGKQAPPPLRSGAAPKPPEDQKGSGQERRAQPRFTTEFRVVLITGAHSFRNTTEDVSMGGMKLKRPVPPAFISQKCTIFVSHPDLRENVQISCKVLADPKDPRRIQFTDTEAGQLKRLEEWLAESAMRNKGVA